jgi:hypothetical protein
MISKTELHLAAERQVLLRIIQRLADIKSISITESEMLKAYALALEEARLKDVRQAEADAIKMIDTWLANRQSSPQPRDTF